MFFKKNVLKKDFEKRKILIAEAVCVLQKQLLLQLLIKLLKRYKKSKNTKNNSIISYSFCASGIKKHLTSSGSDAVAPSRVQSSWLGLEDPLSAWPSYMLVIGGRPQVDLPRGLLDVLMRYMWSQRARQKPWCLSMA